MAVKRILRYLKGTMHYRLTLGKFDGTQDDVSVYTDADYAGDTLSRRSTTGLALRIGSSLITWASKLQKSVALSTAEGGLTQEALALDPAWA